MVVRDVCIRRRDNLTMAKTGWTDVGVESDWEQCENENRGINAAIRPCKPLRGLYNRIVDEVNKNAGDMFPCERC